MNPSYFNHYQNLAMERTDSGILTLRLHTDGGPIVFTGQTHRDLPPALAEIGADRNNKIVILTGTGDVFMDEIDGASLGETFKPGEWDKIYWEGRRVLQRLLEIEAPIIAAVNGPATVHSEYVLLADITIASEDATFSDKPHMGFGIVPGDGIHVIYEELLGVNRARYFALTQQQLEAQEAKELGLVNEVVPKSEVYDRAFAIAEQLAAKPQLFLRYTTVALRQRLLKRLNEGTQLGMALEGLTAADLAYQPQPAHDPPLATSLATGSTRAAHHTRDPLAPRSTRPQPCRGAPARRGSEAHRTADGTRD
jgi:enoyl-CoA hydratase/carnithine racemase